VRFPLVLKQTVEESVSPLLFYGKTLDYGNYEDVILNHQEEKNVGFEIKLPVDRYFKLDMRRMMPSSFWRRLEEIGLVELLDNYDELSVIVEVGKQRQQNSFNGELEVKNFTIKLGDKEALNCTITKSRDYEITVMDMYSFREELQFNGFIPVIDYQIQNFADETTDDESNSKKNIMYFVRSLLRNVNQYINKSSELISYIGPFRRTPERNYRYREVNLRNIGAYGEFTPEILASYYRRKDKDFFKKLNDWLKHHLNVNVVIEDLKGSMYRILVKDLSTNVTNNINDVGFGLSQVLPIIVQIFMNKSNEQVRSSRSYSRINKINIIEQPELHLHPAAQADLIDLFIKGYKLSGQDYFLIETHSEHLILRLRRRIIEKTINAEDVAIYYIEKTGEVEESTTIKKLKISEDGNILEWPEDFFDQDYQEISAIKKLTVNQKKGEFEW
jgi:hypothetical protein